MPLRSVKALGETTSSALASAFLAACFVFGEPFIRENAAAAAAAVVVVVATFLSKVSSKANVLLQMLGSEIGSTSKGGYQPQVTKGYVTPISEHMYEAGMVAREKLRPYTFEGRRDTRVSSSRRRNNKTKRRGEQKVQRRAKCIYEHTSRIIYKPVKICTFLSTWVPLTSSNSFRKKAVRGSLKPHTSSSSHLTPAFEAA